MRWPQRCDGNIGVFFIGGAMPEPFIRTYVFEDHDHIYLQKIGPQHARSLVKKGPHFQDMTYLQRGGAGEVII